MSCSITAARVDWEEFSAFVDQFLNPRDLFNAKEPDSWVYAEGEEWEEYFESYDYAMYFMEEVYENLRGALSDEQRKVTDPIVNLVASAYYIRDHAPDNFPRDRHEKPEYFELPFDLDERHRRLQWNEGRFSAVLSPETVGRYLTMWEQLPYEELREGFESLQEQRADDPDWEFVEDWIEDWPRFRGYFDAFRHQLEKADEDGKAFILQVAC